LRKGIGTATKDRVWLDAESALSTPIDLSALARHDEEIVGICTWTPMDSEYMLGTYEGTCGVAWSFTEGGLSENETLFCPRCGGKIIDATKGEKD
jgi:hypothetical protein